MVDFLLGPSFLAPVPTFQVITSKAQSALTITTHRRSFRFFTTSVFCDRLRRPSQSLRHSLRISFVCRSSGELESIPFPFSFRETIPARPRSLLCPTLSFASFELEHLKGLSAHSIGCSSLLGSKAETCINNRTIHDHPGQQFYSAPRT